MPQSKMLLDILKKIYKKNVELVKENQILKQQLSATKKKLIETESAARTTSGNGARNLKSRHVSLSYNILSSFFSRYLLYSFKREVNPTTNSYSTRLCSFVCLFVCLFYYSITKLQSSVKARESARGGRAKEKDGANLSFRREPFQKAQVGSQIKAGKLMNELNLRLNQEQKQR